MVDVKTFFDLSEPLAADRDGEGLSSLRIRRLLDSQSCDVPIRVVRCFRHGLGTLGGAAAMLVVPTAQAIGAISFPFLPAFLIHGRAPR